MRDSQDDKSSTASPGISISTPGVCGPDVTDEVTKIWTKIQNDFRIWTSDQRLEACTRVLLPVKAPHFVPGQGPQKFVRSMADINGWDVLPLFQGASRWLREPRIFDSTLNGPCASPSSLNPRAGNFDDAHESPLTCSNTVQVSGQCWLNGTVNYGTYGIMVRLCKDEFTRFTLGLQMAKALIKTYKSLGAHPEDATLPIAWVEATYNGGPAGRPSVPGNRPLCKCLCPFKGNEVAWDYVWEPVKSRSSATPPK